MRRLALRFATAVVALTCAVAFVITPETGAQPYPPGSTTTVVGGTTTTSPPGATTTTTPTGATTTTAPTGATTTTIPTGVTTTVPGAACTTPSGSQDVGGVNVGASFTVRIQPVCLFDVGSLVSLTVNGQGIGTKEADASGGINVSVRVVSTTTIEIDDPITVAAQCGVNTVVATGESDGTPVSQTASFTILCPGGAATAVRGRVAFTGANILRWGGGAVLLVALGSVLLTAARRRSRVTGA